MTEPTTGGLSSANAARRARRPPPGLLRRDQAARFCAMKESTWDRHAAAGLTPAPIKIGGLVCWSRRELLAWADYHCPPRAEWQPRWDAIRATRHRR